MIRIPMLLFIALTGLPVMGQSLQTTTNQVAEWEYISEKQYDNPFREVVLIASSIHKESGDKIEVPAFWAGGNSWKFRFSRPEPGIYNFQTVCSDKGNSGLHRQKGKVTIAPYQGDNPLYTHGAIQVSDNGKYLQHYDGTPFFWLADPWWHGMTTRFRLPEDFTTLAQDRKDNGFNV